MADYINKNILVEAYIKLDKNIDQFSPDEIISLQTNLQEFAEVRSRFFLDTDVDAEVILAEGSIKTWLTVLGSAYVLISQYPDFRNGVQMVYSDAKRLAEYLISETMFELNGKSSSVIRTEARVGVIGNINNIVVKISILENAVGDADVRILSRVLINLNREVDHLFGNLTDHKDRSYLQENLYILVKKIPPTPRNPKKGKHHPEDVAVYEDRLKELLEKLRRTNIG